MSNVPLYGWLKASLSLRLVKRVTCFLLFNWKNKRNSKWHHPNPPVLFIGLVLDAAAIWAVPDGSDAPWLQVFLHATKKNKLPCATSGTMCAQKWHTCTCASFSPQQQGALTGPGSHQTRREVHWVTWGLRSCDGHWGISPGQRFVCSCAHVSLCWLLS